MQVFESRTADAALNAAYEESVFRRPAIAEPILMLYRNSESILFGRNQNPWAECEVEHCLSEGVTLLRRLSGGGTVYQDDGNLNYSFFLPRASYEPSLVLDILQEALLGLGVPDVGVRDRTSVCSGPCKISGTAFALNGRVAMLHGCILVAADLKRLHQLLEVDADKTVTGAYVASNRVPVTSLKALGMAVTCDELATSLTEVAARQFGPVCRIGLPADDAVQTLRKKYADPEWTYGRSGDFEISRSTGRGLLRLTVSHGVVTSASLDGMEMEEFVDLPLHEIM